MANSFDKNFTLKLAETFLEEFETVRVLSKNVNTQFLDGQFNPSTGATVAIRRPTDFVTRRTAAGDVSGGNPTDIITAQASGTVQDYFTVRLAYDEADEAIKMDKLAELLKPAATRIVTDLELDFAGFMMRNSGLLAGVHGNAIASWEEVAEAGSIMESSGVPKDKMWMYAVNPFTQRALAADQRSLGAGGVMGTSIKNSNEAATIARNFAGMDVKTATGLASYTADSEADRVGAIDTAGIDVTYATNKDTMTQSILVTSFGADLEIRAGEVIQFTGINRLNLSTRQPILNEAGANVLFTAVVTTDVILDASGEGTIVVSGPAIFEALGSYNTTETAAAAATVLTVLGAASAKVQPNLFWHPNAFSIGSVGIKKLHSTDTLATTEDGMQIRVSKGVDFLGNEQLVRFDLRVAYSVLNPFFAGHSFGRP